MLLEGLNVSPTVAGSNVLPIARWKWDQMTTAEQVEYMRGRRITAESYRHLLPKKHDNEKPAGNWLEQYRTGLAAQYALEMPETNHCPASVRAELLARECLEISSQCDLAETLRRVSDLMRWNGIQPEKTQATMHGLIARSHDAAWWKRQLKKVNRREVEQGDRIAGRIHANGQLYVSDRAVMERRERDRMNCEMLDAVTVENQDGYQATLFELASAGVANPKNRRHEMMTRINGIDQWSRQQGLYAGLWTLTTPSRFHASKLVKSDKREWRSTRRNKKFDQSLTPRHAQEWLCAVWARIRAEFKRKGIEVHGLRGAEPHHDGTPHWHFVIFMKAEQSAAAKSIFSGYALEDAPEEDPAGSVRVDFKDIDYAKHPRGAVGYAAKYIAKAIGGFDLSDSAIETDKQLAEWANNAADDESGKEKQSVIETSERVAAWAAVWGIRQFQFFGLEFCPVGLWRQFRKFDAEEVPAEFDLDLALDSLRMMADEGDFSSFIEAQRILRAVLEKQTPLTEIRVPRISHKTGEYRGETVTQELKCNRYGEIVDPVPVAILGERARVPVVKNEWRVVEIDAARIRGAWSSGNNCTGVGNGRKTRTASAGDCAKNGRTSTGADFNADDEGGRNSASSRPVGKLDAENGGAAGPGERGAAETSH